MTLDDEHRSCSPVRTSCYVFGGRALIELSSLAARGRRISIAGALLLSASACAVMGPSAPPVHVVSIPLPASVGLRDESEYQSAARAIKQRDYGLALDLLQDARTREPDDIRVLNAFGVVYDKLGRFDLSARYYAGAAEIDPSSAIVRNNLAYSRKLQGLAADATPPTEFAALPQPTQPATHGDAPTVPSTADPTAQAADLRTLPVAPATLRVARAPTIEAASITADAPAVRLEQTAAAPVSTPLQTVTAAEIAFAAASPPPTFEASAARPLVTPVASAPVVQLAPTVEPQSVRPEPAAAAPVADTQIALTAATPEPAVGAMHSASPLARSRPFQPGPADGMNVRPEQAVAAIAASAGRPTVVDAPMPVTGVAQPEGVAPAVAVEAFEPDRTTTELQDARRVVASAAYSAVGSPPVAWVRTPLQQADHPSIVYLSAATRMADTQSLVVINASGRRFGVGTIRVALIRRGWSPPRMFASRRYYLAHTTIRYARADGAIARSLARTLPGRTRLVVCARECQGVRLIVGADVVSWRLTHWMQHYG
jgi:hypothetical protein